jgi:hypothetical protein
MARAYARGGVSVVARIAGIARSTIGRGIREIGNEPLDALVRVIASLAAVQALVILPVLPRLLATGTDRAGRPAANGWYWASLLTAGTLGTAVGDFVAEELPSWRRGRYTRPRRNVCGHPRHEKPIALEDQSQLLAVRSAGTTACDRLAFREEPGLSNGLHLGLPLSYGIHLHAICWNSPPLARPVRKEVCLNHSRDECSPEAGGIDGAADGFNRHESMVFGIEVLFACSKDFFRVLHYS